MPGDNARAPHSIKLWLRKKKLNDNIPIHFNNWTLLNMTDTKDKHKSTFVWFSILTNNHGVGHGKSSKDPYFGSKMALGSVQSTFALQFWNSVRQTWTPRPRVSTAKIEVSKNKSSKLVCPMMLSFEFAEPLMLVINNTPHTNHHKHHFNHQSTNVVADHYTTSYHLHTSRNYSN